MDDMRQASGSVFYNNAIQELIAAMGRVWIYVKKMNEVLHTLSGFHNCSVASQDQPIRQGRQLFPFHHMRP
jgi:hypothetical protein